MTICYRCGKKGATVESLIGGNPIKMHKRCDAAALRYDKERTANVRPNWTNTEGTEPVDFDIDTANELNFHAD